MNSETRFQFDVENNALSESEILEITKFTVYESEYEANSIFDQIRRFSVNNNHEVLIQCEDYLCFIDANGTYLYSLYQDDFTDTRAYFRYLSDNIIEMIYPYDNIYLRIDNRGACLTVVQIQNTKENLQRKMDFIESCNRSDYTIDDFTYHLENFGTRLIKTDTTTGDSDVIFQIDQTKTNTEFLRFNLFFLSIFVISLLGVICFFVKKHKKK